MANAVIINDPDLHKKLKLKAAENGEKMSKVAENILRENLDNYKSENSEEEKEGA